MHGEQEADDAANENAEVDVSLIDWYLSLSVIERLRAASRSAATLERLRRLHRRRLRSGALPTP